MFSLFSTEANESKSSLAEAVQALQLSETKLKAMESDMCQKNMELESLRTQIQSQPEIDRKSAGCQTASSDSSRSSPSSKTLFEQQVRLLDFNLELLKNSVEYISLEKLSITYSVVNLETTFFKVHSRFPYIETP